MLISRLTAATAGWVFAARWQSAEQSGSGCGSSLPPCRIQLRPDTILVDARRLLLLKDVQMVAASIIFASFRAAQSVRCLCVYDRSVMNVHTVSLTFFGALNKHTGEMRSGPSTIAAADSRF